MKFHPEPTLGINHTSPLPLQRRYFQCMPWRFLLLGYIATWLLLPHVLLARKRPAATLAWVWSILLFPYAGALFYLLFGGERFLRKRMRRAAKARLFPHDHPTGTPELIAALPNNAADMLRALATINKTPTSSATHLRLLVDAREFYPALSEAIAKAQHHVHFESFIWRDDARGHHFLTLLTNAARRGVQVRLLLDQIGCLGTPSQFFHPLLEAGAQFAWFYPLPFGRHLRFLNLRNHRKLQIIDGSLAFIGGMNIGCEYAGEDPSVGPWRDAQLAATGHVVTTLQETFATDWHFATKEKITGPQFYPETPATSGHLCQVIVGGPDTPREPIPKSLISLLNFATSRVWIATGYFAPDTPLLTALQLCALRGVDVRLLISERSDHRCLVHVGRSYYEDLLRYGIRVFEYSAAVNHSKAILIDTDWILIGSANSDNRSMRLNFELNLLAHCTQTASQLAAMLAKDFSDSTEMHLADFSNRPLGQRLLEATLRPLAPLL